METISCFSCLNLSRVAAKLKRLVSQVNILKQQPPVERVTRRAREHKPSHQPTAGTNAMGQHSLVPLQR